MRKFFQEFKAFISKGNVFDMAVGLIIATAFNKIVSSLVNDIIMPLVTWSTGASSLEELSVVLRVGEDGKELLWKYGTFCQTVIDFLIIAFSVFLMVKVVTGSRKKLEELSALVVKETKKEVRAEKKAVKAQAKAEGKKFKQAWAEHLEAKRIQAEEKAKVEAEAKKLAEEEARKANPTDNDLLKEIRDMLKAQNTPAGENKVAKTKKTAKAKTPAKKKTAKATK